MADEEFVYLNGQAVATEDHIKELKNELEELRSRVRELENRPDN